MRTVITMISDVLRKNEGLTGTIEAYVFGSAISLNTKPNDIDILVIYNEPWQTNVIRGALHGVDHVTLNLIFMLPEEQLEMNFIALQECVSVL